MFWALRYVTSHRPYCVWLLPLNTLAGSNTLQQEWNHLLESSMVIVLGKNRLCSSTHLLVGMPFADYEELSRRLAAPAPEVLISAPLHAYLHGKCCIKGLSTFPMTSPYSYWLYKKALNPTYQRRHLLSSFYIFNELISFYLCIW